MLVMKNLKQKLLIGLTVIVFLSLITFIIIFQLISSQNNEKHFLQQQLIQEAKAHHQGIVNTRSWNAQFEGVYVKATNGLNPNPYLKNNTLLTATNETLIKINPAWMTRQISDISNSQGEYHFKITSLLPLNPSNKADDFEEKALIFFQNNSKEKFFYSFNNEKKSFDFMGSLIVKKSCLNCHEEQGYKVGDIRGGIRVSIPLRLYNQQVNALEEKTKLSIFIVLIVAITLVFILIWFINTQYKRQYEIEHANEILEDKVSQRTSDLKVVLSHEQHLKDILKIVTEVNEVLITSFSTSNILKNATDKLATNKSYPLIISGLIHHKILEVISKSNEEKLLLPQDIVSLKEEESLNFIFDAIRKSTKLKHAIIEKIAYLQSDEESGRRKSDLKLNWLIALPLINEDDNVVYGTITVFCSREDGFEIEEIRILEKMVQDISIALYSHKQRDSILEMEKQKNANYEETILAFVNIIEQRDSYTAGHTLRVAEYCALIAREIGISPDDIHRLEKAAILHDIGKVATPDTILLKPAKLSHLEYELIKQHSEVGADMLEKISIYKDLATIIRYHHSRYDGKGYPRTSSPDDIPLLSHIMIVCDAFDAMTSNRVYRPRKTIDEALNELKAESGTQFHPNIVKAALIVLKDLNINSTSQMPTSELEKRRMAYFFCDSLTELFNEDYLQTILNTSDHPFKSLNILELKDFTHYNKKYSWEEGNKIIKNFAQFLKQHYPEAIIIRFHGDDFVVLHKYQVKVEKENISNFEKIDQINIDIHHYVIDKYFDFKKFQNL